MEGRFRALHCARISRPVVDLDSGVETLAHASLSGSPHTRAESSLDTRWTRNPKSTLVLALFASEWIPSFHLASLFLSLSFPLSTSHLHRFSLSLLASEFSIDTYLCSAILVSPSGSISSLHSCTEILERNRHTFLISRCHIHIASPFCERSDCSSYLISYSRRSAASLFSILRSKRRFIVSPLRQSRGSPPLTLSHTRTYHPTIPSNLSLHPHCPQVCIHIHHPRQAPSQCRQKPNSCESTSSSLSEEVVSESQR